ncbi:hypothetical protein SUDANB1_00375 [Streptomyces sp. enrichment culture]|uniref:AsnC family transcriptional regulator n=1 Tax=Streptomyces sp. enrichment culture TaxID=1795815 RepID=UPI003F564258
MDGTDEKIIAELTRNARISHSDLAGKVLLSRNAVRQRIERLERQGHIAGYTIVRAGDDTGNVVSALVLVGKDDAQGARAAADGVGTRHRTAGRGEQNDEGRDDRTTAGQAWAGHGSSAFTRVHSGERCLDMWTIIMKAPGRNASRGVRRFSTRPTS